MLINVPKNFDFKRTVYSHGWSELLPFVLDEKNWVLTYTFTKNHSEKSVKATIFEENGQLRLEIDDENFRSEAEEKFRHILRFDDNLDSFYKLAKSEKSFAWIAKTKAGRLLRSPTVYEDLVKTICTTNCSWSLTKNMVKNLVTKLGVNGAFPSPQAMAEVSVEFYRQEIRAGYRSPYFKELAEKVIQGELNPELWLNSALLTKDLKKELKKIKGIGDYAAENLLKLLGRYDGLALDSWLRSRFYEKHKNSQVCSDKEIEQFYERFDRWKGLFIWCDMTKDWH